MANNLVYNAEHDDRLFVATRLDYDNAVRRKIERLIEEHILYAVILIALPVVYIMAIAMVCMQPGIILQSRSFAR